MPKEIQVSITSHRHMTKALREARADIVAHRTAALAACKDDPTGGTWDKRGTAIAWYCDARRRVKHWAALLDQAVIVKGVTQHYTGNAHR